MTYVFFILLAIALTVIQCFIGGTRMIYAFPAYALVGLAGVLSVFCARRGFVRIASSCLGSALLLAGYVILRAFFSPNAYLARADAFMAAACLGVYLITALYLVESRFRIWTIYILVLVAMVHVGLGAYQFRSGNDFMLFGFIANGAYGSRAHGMLICPNHFAGFLEATALLALGLIFWSKPNLPVKFLLLYITAMCLMGVAISGSRGGYLSTVFGLTMFSGICLWIIRTYNRKRFWLWFIAALIALAALFSTAVGIMRYSKPIKDRLAKVDTAAEDVRWYNWLASVDQFKLNPVFGTGAGTHLYYGRLFRRPQLQSDPEHCHNDYLELLSEYGVIGCMLGGVFLFTHIRWGLKTLRRVAVRRFTNPHMLPRSDTLAVTMGALGAVTAVIAHSFVDFNLHIPGNALLFAFLFGILASSGLSGEGEKKKSLYWEAFARGILVFVGLGLTTGVALRFKSEYRTNRARLALGAENFTECIRLAQWGEKRDPANFWNYFYQGEANRAIGAAIPSFSLREIYLQRAIEEYRKGLEIFPQDKNLWVRLGQCLDAICQFENAEQAYCRAIANDPNQGIVYAYYAWHLKLSGELEKAKAFDDLAHNLGTDAKDIWMGNSLNNENHHLAEEKDAQK